MTITPSGSEEANVEIVLDAAGAEGTHPAHVHEGTSCDEFDAAPTFPLADVEDGTSSTTIDVSASELVDGEYVVNVHESADQLDTYVSCAEIPSLDEVLQGL